MGFLLLPHFTIFAGGSHSHVDLVGLRAANSEESPNGVPLILDENFFFSLVADVIRVPAKDGYLGVVAEVRTNAERPEINEEQKEYISNFLGRSAIVEVRFYDSGKPLCRDGDVVCVNIRDTLHWIVHRVDWMNQNRSKLTKDGSWTWSEDSLSDILVMYRYLLRDSPAGAGGPRMG